MVQDCIGGARLGGGAQQALPAMRVETRETQLLCARPDGAAMTAGIVPEADFINPAWGQLGAQTHSAE